MHIKKNKFLIFFFFNILLITIIFILALPISNILKRNFIDDNEYVKNQTILNPEAIDSKITRTMQVKFVAEVDSLLKWNFEAMQKNIEIKIGENNVIKFKGKNISNNAITASATFSAVPEIISPYLIKTECFCFTEQKLNPGETQIFTMVFYLDPSLDLDQDLKDIKDLVFTYRFSEYKS